jgi:hypothetical protein
MCGHCCQLPFAFRSSWLLRSVVKTLWHLNCIITLSRSIRQKETAVCTCGGLTLHCKIKYQVRFVSEENNCSYYAGRRFKGSLLSFFAARCCCCFISVRYNCTELALSLFFFSFSDFRYVVVELKFSSISSKREKNWYFRLQSLPC